MFCEVLIVKYIFSYFGNVLFVIILPDLRNGQLYRARTEMDQPRVAKSRSGVPLMVAGTLPLVSHFPGSPHQLYPSAG